MNKAKPERQMPSYEQVKKLFDQGVTRSNIAIRFSCSARTIGQILINGPKPEPQKDT